MCRLKTSFVEFGLLNHGFKNTMYYIFEMLTEANGNNNQWWTKRAGQESTGVLQETAGTTKWWWQWGTDKSYLVNTFHNNLK